MKVLITGISGFIGRRLADFLVSAGYEVVGVDTNNPYIKNVKIIANDILDKESIIRSCNNVDAIVHLAGIAFVPDATKNENLAHKINVVGTKNLVDAFLKSNAKIFIFASTGKVYGIPKKQRIDESHITKPESAYGKTKLEAEKYIKKHSKIGKKFVILRQFNIFGPAQNTNFIIPTIIRQAQKSNKLILGNIEIKRDFTYIDDIVELYKLILKKNDLPEFDVFNVGSGTSHSIKEIIKLIGAILGKKLKVETDKNKLREEDEDETSDNDKVKKKFGWKPRVKLKDGLKKTVDWYEKINNGHFL